MVEIKHKETGMVLHTVQADSLQRADLWNTDLNGADLTYALLENANLYRANLSCAFLKGANLYRTNLSRVDLSGANLEQANLEHANLRDANLRNANLAGSNLEAACLRGSNLEAADLNRANLWGTDFTACPTLHKAKGLERVFHQGASSLDIVTLRACIKHLSNRFLQGVGFTNREIETLRDLYAQGIQFYSCFLSHSGADSDFVDQLRKDLLDNEVSCWHHLYDMHGGKFWRPQISEAIKVNDKLVLICTEQSVHNDNVAGEVIEAMNREREAKSRKLFPLLLDNFVLSKDALVLADKKMAAQEWAEDWIRYVRQYHIPDFSQWKDHDAYMGKFKVLLKDLKNPSTR